MTDPKKIKTGDILAVIHYVKVESVNGDNVQALDLDGNVGSFGIHGAPLLKRALSADQYSSEEKVSKTDAAEKLIHAINRPFTVAFEKADGTPRVLRGKLIKHEALLGRSMVTDLDSTEKNPVRLVDHRTLLYLIVDDVKYTVKK